MSNISIEFFFRLFDKIKGPTSIEKVAIKEIFEWLTYSWKYLEDNAQEGVSSVYIFCEECNETS